MTQPRRVKAACARQGHMAGRLDNLRANLRLTLGTIPLRRLFDSEAHQRLGLARARAGTPPSVPRNRVCRYGQGGRRYTASLRGVPTQGRAWAERLPTLPCRPRTALPTTPAVRSPPRCTSADGRVFTQDRGTEARGQGGGLAGGCDRRGWAPRDAAADTAADAPRVGDTHGSLVVDRAPFG